MNTQNTQSNSVVAAYAYTLRADGLRTGVIDSGPATSGRTDNWQYDPLDRLTQEAVTGASTVNGTSAFTYDSGNRLTRNSTIQGVSNFSESYNANDQRADEGFDNNGDTTSTGGNAYTFDAEGKLTGATLVTPTTESLTLTYDGDGNLVSKANGSVTTTYLVDTNNPSGYAQIVEAKTNGTLTDVFNYGSAGIISQGHIPTGTTAYFGKDGSNNTRYLTDSQTGNVTDTFDYTADGIQVSRTGNFPLLHQFQGEYLDPDLSLYDLRARWMNPQTGEFMTMDTIEGYPTDPQSLHKYAFTKWDGGVNKKDPSGNDAIDGISEYDANLWSWIGAISVTGTSYVDLLEDNGGGTASKQTVQSLTQAGYRVEEFLLYYKAENQGDAAWRLNNPTGIEYSSTSAAASPQFFGEDATSNPTFFKFQTMTLGLEAFVAVLQKVYSSDTVRAAWLVYSPAFENNLNAYYAEMAAGGIDLDKTVGTQIPLLEKVVPTIELGNPPSSGLIIYKPSI